MTSFSRGVLLLCLCLTLVKCERITSARDIASYRQGHRVRKFVSNLQRDPSFSVSKLRPSRRFRSPPFDPRWRSSSGLSGNVEAFSFAAPRSPRLEERERDAQNGKKADDLKVILLFGRKPNKKKVLTRRKEEKGKHTPKKSRYLPPSEILPPPRFSFPRARDVTSVSRDPPKERFKSSFEDDFPGLHNIAGPPYNHDILTAGLFPEVSYPDFKQRFSSSENNHEEEYAPEIQSFAKFSNSFTHPQTHLHGRTSGSTIMAPVSRIHSRFSERLKGRSNKFEQSPTPKNSRMRKQKFFQKPSYTFSVEDGVQRNYKSNQLRKRNRGYQDIRSRNSGAQLSNTVKSPGKRTHQMLHLFTTVGYPNKSVRLINKKLFQR